LWYCKCFYFLRKDVNECHVSYVQIFLTLHHFFFFKCFNNVVFVCFFAFHFYFSFSFFLLVIHDSSTGGTISVSFGNTWQQYFSYIMVVSFIGGGHHWSATSHWPILSHNVVSNTRCLSGVRITTLVVIGTDCTGSCKYDVT
jgi:hypothetical protein